MVSIRQVVRLGYLPFMLLGLNAAAYVVVAYQYSYLWLAPLLLTAFAAAHLAERVLPHFEEWNESHGDANTNVLHNAIYELSNLSAVMTIPLLVWLFPFQGIWPTHWSIGWQLLLAIALADFAFTMLHFISHRVPLLWRLHAVHHGVGRLVGFNGLVRHPLHQSVDLWLGSAPLVIMGMPVDVAVLLGFAISIQLVVQHSNVAVALGPLRQHLSIGAVHHLHHVNWGKEGDCNFGLFFTWWDRVLGTYQLEPSRPITAADMGIDDAPDFPSSYLDQLMFPFRYKPGTAYPGQNAPGLKTQRQTAETTRHHAEMERQPAQPTRHHAKTKRHRGGSEKRRRTRSALG